jgi:hypothetical protein
MLIGWPYVASQKIFPWLVGMHSLISLHPPLCLLVSPSGIQEVVSKYGAKPIHVAEEFLSNR